MDFLAHGAQLSDFEEIIRFPVSLSLINKNICFIGSIFLCKLSQILILKMFRTSEDLRVILPSLRDVKTEVSLATSWLTISKPFLESVVPMSSSSRSQLKIETLKVLVFFHVWYIFF